MEQTFFDFTKEKVQLISLAQLALTAREINPRTNLPYNGVAHHVFIEAIIEAISKAGLHAEVFDMFAANNLSKDRPGVSLIPALEQVKGDMSIEAHILRRVYTTLRITNWDDDTYTTYIAISYHQRGIEMAMGNAVRICHNQTILGTKTDDARYIKSWDNNLSPTDMLEILGYWLETGEEYIRRERAELEMLKTHSVNLADISLFIGQLTTLRVGAESGNKNLRTTFPDFPLSSAQINRFTEMVLEHFDHTDEDTIPLYDVYNFGTELLKPMQVAGRDISIPTMDTSMCLSKLRIFTSVFFDSIGLINDSSDATPSDATETLEPITDPTEASSET